MAKEVIDGLNEDSKYKEFLDVLRDNPETIENSVIKERYKKLLEDIIFDEVNKDFEDFEDFDLSVYTLLKSNIWDKTDKEYYKELLNISFEKVEEGYPFC